MSGGQRLEEMERCRRDETFLSNVYTLLIGEKTFAEQALREGFVIRPASSRKAAAFPMSSSLTWKQSAVCPSIFVSKLKYDRERCGLIFRIRICRRLSAHMPELEQSLSAAADFHWGYPELEGFWKRIMGLSSHGVLAVGVDLPVGVSARCPANHCDTSAAAESITEGSS